MDEQEKQVNIVFDRYKDVGLYLVLPDGAQLVLTRKHIQKVAEEFWKGPDEMSAEVKNALKSQKCSTCPLGEDELCSAMEPVIPLLKDIDKYVSFDHVTAVYKGYDESLHVAFTTMQAALRYISALSLIRYCQAGRKYLKYFHGLHALMGGEEIASRIYLNIYWFHEGKKEEIDKAISEFYEYLLMTSKDQVERLNRVCKNDAFINAFVSTQMATEFLQMGIDKMLAESVKEFEKAVIENL